MGTIFLRIQTLNFIKDKEGKPTSRLSPVRLQFVSLLLLLNIMFVSLLLLLNIMFVTLGLFNQSPPMLDLSTGSSPAASDRKLNPVPFVSVKNYRSSSCIFLQVFVL